MITAEYSAEITFTHDTFTPDLIILIFAFYGVCIFRPPVVTSPCFIPINRGDGCA